MLLKATKKQIDYIRALGGEAPAGINIFDASELIDTLRESAPATPNQLAHLERLTPEIPAELTAAQASILISKLDGMRPPTAAQIRQLLSLGAKVPDTRDEAEQLCEELRNKALATSQQHDEAVSLGVSLPPGTTHANAENLLREAWLDAHHERGRSPQKAQLKRIATLHGDPSVPPNRWRADKYIGQLEAEKDAFNDRVIDVIDAVFGDVDTRRIMSVRKPSRTVMAAALRYGDAQGWGPNWDDTGNDGPYNAFSLIDVAVFAVAPDLLKKGAEIPRVQSFNDADRGTGCLSLLLIMLGSLSFLVLHVLIVTEGKSDPGSRNIRFTSPDFIPDGKGLPIGTQPMEERPEVHVDFSDLLTDSVRNAPDVE